MLVKPSLRKASVHWKNLGTKLRVPRSIVVDYLKRSFQQRQDVAVTYIYCSYKEQEEQTCGSLVASLLQQLAQNRGTISNDVASLYRSHTRQQTRPTLQEYSKLLQSEICYFSTSFIVVDALDECSEINGTRSRFLAEIRKLPSNVRLLITSRYISAIESEFERTTCVEIRASDEDVARYIQGRIQREPRLARHIRADPGLQKTIIDNIVQRAKGM